MAVMTALMLVFLLPSCSTQVRVQKRPHQDPSVDVYMQGGYYPYNRNYRKSKSLPPGQVKKVTGSQSAAPYAPGHNKKKGGR